MKKIGVAILGLGDVGGGAYQILTERREFYQRTQGVDIEVVSVLEKDRSRTECLNVPEEKIASNIAEVVGNPDVNVVVECIGGMEAAKEYALAALNIGKSFVTSNIELYAKYSHELERVAKRHNAGLFFGASCMGGIPVVRTFLDGLTGDRICSVTGTVNNGAEEDAIYQLAVLSSFAFHTKVPFAKVVREKAQPSKEDIKAGETLGYTLKTLAIGKNTDAGIEVRLSPAFVKKSHPLSAVKGDCSAVLVKGDASGEVMLYGGNGARSMAGALVSDVIYAATHVEIKYSTFKNAEEPSKDAYFTNDYASAYFLRLTATAESGVFAKITSALAKSHISVVEATAAKGEDGKVTLLFVTDETRESAVNSAIEKITSTQLVTVEAVVKAVF